MANHSAIDFPHLPWTNETFGEGIRLQGLAVLLNYFLSLINSCLPLAHATQPLTPSPARPSHIKLSDSPAAGSSCSAELPSLPTKAPGTWQPGLNYVLLVLLINCHC